MNDNKNLIEIIKIDGLDISIQRQSGNCWVNLTDMASRYGKQPSQWLRTAEAKDFLNAVQKCKEKESLNEPNDSKLQKCSLGNQELIITRKGGSLSHRGTWCTDYNVAVRFAMWLDSYFAVLVIKTFIRVMNGEFILDEEGCIPTADGRKWVTREPYCKKLGRSPSSFAGLKAHYPHHFELVNDQHVMSREFFLYQSKKTNFEEERISFKLPVEDKRQLALPFAEYEEIKEG